MSPQATARSKTADSEKPVTKRWDLANGSLFVMQGDTQKNWKVSVGHKPRIPFAHLSPIISMRFLNNLKSRVGAYP